MTHRTVFVLAAMIAMMWPAAVQAQRPEPQVEIVQTVGCVEQRNGDDATWWLTRSADPTETRAGVFNVNQVEEAKEEALGSSLVGPKTVYNLEYFRHDSKVH